jgi:hypothetical protein
VRFVWNEGFYFGEKHASVDFEFGLTSTDYYFVHARHFCDPTPWVHVVPPLLVPKVFSASVLVKANYSTEQNRIVNHGSSVTVVARATNTVVRPVSIIADDLRPGRGNALQNSNSPANRVSKQEKLLSTVAAEAKKRQDAETEFHKRAESEARQEKEKGQ